MGTDCLLIFVDNRAVTAFAQSSALIGHGGYFLVLLGGNGIKVLVSISLRSSSQILSLGTWSVY